MPGKKKTKIFTILSSVQVDMTSMKKQKFSKFLISVFIYIILNWNMRFLDQVQWLLFTVKLHQSLQLNFLPTYGMMQWEPYGQACM